jgi:hypothetical protein
LVKTTAAKTKISMRDTPNEIANTKAKTKMNTNTNSKITIKTRTKPMGTPQHVYNGLGVLVEQENMYSLGFIQCCCGRYVRNRYR